MNKVKCGDDQLAGFIIDRMREALNVERDKDLAKLLKVSPGTIATWRTRKSVPYEHCIRLAMNTGVNLNWLFFGDGAKDEFKTPKGPVNFSLLRRIIETLEVKLSVGSEGDPVEWTPQEKAQWVCSTYRVWAAGIEELISTGKFTQEEAIPLLQRTLPEGYRLRK